MYKSYNFAILGSRSKHSNHKFWKRHGQRVSSAISHPILSPTLHAVYVSSATCKWVTAVCTQTPAPISPSNAKSPWSPWSIADALEFLSCLQTVACPHDEGRHKNIILKLQRLERNNHSKAQPPLYLQNKHHRLDGRSCRNFWSNLRFYCRIISAASNVALASHKPTL